VFRKYRFHPDLAISIPRVRLRAALPLQLALTPPCTLRKRRRFVVHPGNIGRLMFTEPVEVKRASRKGSMEGRERVAILSRLVPQHRPVTYLVEVVISADKGCYLPAFSSDIGPCHSLIVFTGGEMVPSWSTNSRWAFICWFLYP
jgi:hypothetical protein